MVHALRRATGLVRPDGLLIDLHPTADEAQLAVVHADGSDEAIGPLRSETSAARHANAGRAIATAIDQRIASRVAAHVFVFSRYSDSVDELAECVRTKWSAEFDAPTLAQARAALRRGSRLRLWEYVAITALRPLIENRPTAQRPG